jgi:hypothetical protein
VNCTGKPLEILTKLKKLAGYDPDEEIELYEVGLCHLFHYLFTFVIKLVVSTKFASDSGK